ncbi:sugar transferase [Guptibacillus algicola]|uniref:sugar transferase n=1 Tax=Guptibacillus algicola TaxID=225844 RepID=UPI001CD39F2E|nr:sugar transferase [Alkalihalobacillus algicola]MCA0987045.1 sugar transferase [Alkalihalobacillus algicola]
MKRFCDVLFSVILILLLSILIIVVSILIMMKIGRPILFRQERIGYKEKPFIIYKFRTMTNECDCNGMLLPSSERLTSFGRIFRKWSIDELPQLINVLKGDMSFIGPRPLLPRYLPYYEERERKRHLVRPGITGIAQITGRNQLEWGERLALDVHYVENLSFRYDMKIAILTIIKVLKRENVEEDPGKHLINLDLARKDSVSKEGEVQ